MFGVKMSELVTRENHDEIVLLTLNRPEKLNALTFAMIDRLLVHLDEIETDRRARVIVLTGAGDRAFCAGGDIRELAESLESGIDRTVRDFCRRGQRLTARLEAYPKPVIAAINGIAFGGGCEITEAVHLAVASENAVFAKPEINIAIPPAFGGTQRLPRLAGRKRALELLLTGDAFTPERALDIGLVNTVVAPDELINHTFSLAERILRHSPITAARILTAVTRGINTTIDEGLQIEQEQFARMCATRDMQEGLNAWLDRRKPAYSGT